MNSLWSSTVRPTASTLLATFGLATICLNCDAAPCTVTPQVMLAMNASGQPAGRWIEAIRDRLDSTELAAVVATARPLSAGEARWLELIRDQAPHWCQQIERLNAPFRRTSPPPRLTLLLGNQGGDDAFTSGADVIAIDLGALLRAYGEAGGDVQRSLVWRLLSHEYTHLLVRPYLDSIGWSEEWAARDPLLQALRTLYNEGHANLRSIEDPRWIAANGQPTDLARAALGELQPRLIERLQGLAAHPAPAEAAKLMRNISQGPLAKKWGALPMGIWLASDTGLKSARLAEWVEAGPQRILELAVRNADPQFRAAFQQLLDQAGEHVAANRPSGSAP